jgi:hypothetical protein
MPRRRQPKQGSRRITIPFELIHVDLVGPFHTASRGGNKYIITIFENGYRKVTVIPIQRKSDTADMLIGYCNYVERQTKYKVKLVRMDNGREFTGQN